MTRRRNGSIRKLESGRYQVRVSRGSTVDGNKRTLCDTCDTYAEAERRAAEMYAELGAVGHSRVTLDLAWLYYLAHKAPRLATKTVNDYRRYMDGLWCRRYGDTDISTLTAREIQTALLDCPTRDVAAHARRAISSVLTFAVTQGLLDTSPMRGVRFELPADAMDDSAFDRDPFAAIEGTRDVWGAQTVLECFERIRGLPLEPVWLAMVGGGLRMEEAFALRRVDVRRVSIAGREVTQVAVHHARTDVDERKLTKTRRSVRIAAVVDPFGARLWEIAEPIVDGTRLVCGADPANQNRRWRSYFAEPPAYHKRMSESRKVAGRLHGLPYLPLSRMRATHETLMQEAGVLDSLNAAVHGHSERVSYANYQRADGMDAAMRLAEHLAR